MRRRTPAFIILVALVSLPWTGKAEGPFIATLQIHGTRRVLELETRAGQPFDAARVERDVRRLWSTGWFEDIQVATDDLPHGVQITFSVTEKPRLYLRDVRFEPGGERIHVEMAKGASIDRVAAARLAAKLRQELVEQGYAEARVESEIVPADFRRADLWLRVKRGELYEFDEIRFAGESGLRSGELRKPLASIRPRQILPALRPFWGGWKWRAPYSRTRLQAAVEKLRSLYLSRGYFDARIDVADTQVVKGKVVVTLRIDSGPRYNIARWEMVAGGTPPWRVSFAEDDILGQSFCRCLHQAREESEKRGEFGFTTWMEIMPADTTAVDGKSEVQSPRTPSSVNATIRIEPGPVYRVGRIEFRGHRVVSDSTLRKALVLQEGDLFDARRLRRSLARLNRIAPLQGVDPSEVRFEPRADRGLVNLTIPVKERPRGSWALSGPLGPLGAFGPLRYSMGSRLPAVGRGPLELSTYYASFSLAGWPTALAGIAGFGSSFAWGAVAALERPHVPGQRWTSGILCAPQLGWRGTVAGYGLAQLNEVTRTVLGTDALPAPALSIPVAWRTRGARPPILIGVLQCPAPKPRLAWLRSVATAALDSAATLLRTGHLL